ncbi:MAG: DUF4105 domain-containing protein [Burkholderiales bacterium]|nr:DUF4105 domain-containing protein [Burkholderiales bacterium]
MRKFLRLFGLSIVWLVVLASTAWGGAALWFDGPASRPLAAAFAAAFALLVLALLFKVRPLRRAYAACLILFALLLGWWLGLTPSNSRDWQRDVAQLPKAEILGDKITIRNLRNFEYRSETDYTARWDTRTYDLAKLRGLDLFVVYWGSPSIAHTILSWEFDDGQHLAVSIETRKEAGEDYSAVAGFFRQYELYYVVADERDVVGLRTNFRREDVYLYKLRTPPARARALLLDYLKSVNHLAQRPKWYNALSHNCTTTIRLHADDVVSGIPHDWRWLANGYLDELLYEMGVVNHDLPFAELKQRSYINPKAQAAGMDEAFSGAIRAGLPSRPPPPPM